RIGTNIRRLLDHHVRSRSIHLLLCIGTPGPGGATTPTPAVPARVFVSATGGLLPFGQRIFSATERRHSVCDRCGAGRWAPCLVAVLLVPGAFSDAERISGAGTTCEPGVDRARDFWFRNRLGLRAFL